MELNISELDQQYLYNSYEQIPENIPVKVTKKGSVSKNQVKLDDNNDLKPMKQSIPKPYAKMVRPHVPEPKPQISYDDILSKMGMFVSNGQLHLLENQPKEIKQQIKQQTKQSKPLDQQYNQQSPPVHIDQQNSYIYNKYFSNEMKDDASNIRVPKNMTEYKNMLVHDILQKQRIKQIKSTKLIMPSSNINYAPNKQHNLNKLFSFSSR
jgi:hypothetical protein